MRDSGFVFLIVQRHYLFLKNAIEFLCVSGVAVVASISVKGPAVLAVEPLDPPAIQNAQLGRSIYLCLHSASTAGLEGWKGIVQPEVHSLNQVLSDLLIIVFNKGNAAAKGLVFGSVEDLLDQKLAGVV